ncbi:MAG: hypothetical protein D6835_05485, partial [Candidatus Thermofonsia bacterium]
MKKFSLLFIMLSISLSWLVTEGQAQTTVTPRAYLPIIVGPPAFSCATTSTNSYISGTVYQFDTDNPVRPAYNHADKNIS